MAECMPEAECQPCVRTVVVYCTVLYCTVRLGRSARRESGRLIRQVIRYRSRRLFASILPSIAAHRRSVVHRMHLPGGKVGQPDTETMHGMVTSGGTVSADCVPHSEIVGKAMVNKAITSLPHPTSRPPCKPWTEGESSPP